MHRITAYPLSNLIGSRAYLIVKAFLAQYDHDVDTALYSMSLMTMEKKEIEGFKDYV